MELLGERVLQNFQREKCDLTTRAEKKMRKYRPWFENSESLRHYTNNTNRFIQQDLPDTSTKMSVYHFLTFHRPYAYSKKQEARYADSLGIANLKAIMMVNPTATIIVMSDHGERQVLVEYKNKIRGIAVFIFTIQIF